MPSKPKILAINGSAQDPSMNARVLNLMAETLKEEGVEVEILHLRAAELPLFRGYVSDVDYTVEEKKNIEAVQEKLKSADGFIIAVPEYHHAIPATLKNMFEFLSSNESPFEDKAVGLFGASMTRFGPLRAAPNMYGILRTFKGVLIPDELYISRVQELFDENGKILDETMLEFIQNFSRRVVDFTKRLM